MYAPFGAGVLVGPRAAFADGDPFLVGGGAVDSVDLDEVMWTEPPEREEAGSPNVVGAVALHAAIDELRTIGWASITGHEAAIAAKLRSGLAAIPGVRVLGPPLDRPTLAVASFVVEGVHHALVAARLSAEFGIATRHGCFCAHPYLFRLLGLTPRGDRPLPRGGAAAGTAATMPGAVRASAGSRHRPGDVERLLGAVARIAGGGPPPVPYRQDRRTGDFHPCRDIPGLTDQSGAHAAPCSPG